MLFQNGKFQWKRAEKLLGLAKEGSGGLDITSTVRDALKVVLLDDKLRMQLVNAFTEDNKLHVAVRAVLLWLPWYTYRCIMLPCAVRVSGKFWLACRDA